MHEPSKDPVRREKLVGLHRLPVEAKRRGSNQMPVYPPNCVELVAHVHWVIVGLDFVERRRPHADVVWMGRFVQHLTALMGEDGVAYGFGGQDELHVAPNNFSHRPNTTK